MKRRSASCLFVILLLQSSIFLSSCKQQEKENDPESPIMLAGDWVPEDPRTLDFDNLPKLPKSDHIIVHDVRDLDGHRVNQHNYLTFYDGKFWAMWSDGPGVVRRPPGQHRDTAPGHEQPHQKVSYATSEDGMTWSEAKDITDTPPAPDGWIARGFWIREGELLALASRFKSPGYHGYGLSLHAFKWDPDEDKWKHHGMVQDNALSNFPPGKLPSGEWMMSRRDSTQHVHVMYGGVKAFNDWTSISLVSHRERSDVKVSEPVWWPLPNGKVVQLYRDNARGGFLYRSVSLDSGKTWTDPLKTNFPDATSKFNAVRLSDGRYVMVSNPDPKKRDPLALSVSDDGVVFTKMVYLVGGRKVDYPDIMEHDGYLYVAFGSAKQSVEIIRVKISDLDAVKMPSEPLIRKK